MLSAAGAKPRAFEGWEPARIELKRGRDAQPDLILMDLRMPVISGRDAILELRSLGVVTPVLVVTATSSEREIASAMNAGANGCLLKPFTSNELMQACDTLLWGFSPGFRAA